MKELALSIKGIAQRHSTQMKQMNDKVVNLTIRSMERNITISGLTGDMREEKCK